MTADDVEFRVVVVVVVVVMVSRRRKRSKVSAQHGLNAKCRRVKKIKGKNKTIGNPRGFVLQTMNRSYEVSSSSNHVIHKRGGTRKKADKGR